jgi:hypothetical protein
MECSPFCVRQHEDPNEYCGPNGEPRLRQALLYAKLQPPPTGGWEDEEKMSYDAQKLADEYRKRLYKC